MGHMCATIPKNPSQMHHVLHGESITDQASPRTPTQRTFQPQEAVQPQRNQTTKPDASCDVEVLSL